MEIVLNSKQKQRLKAQAHGLKPVVMIGSKGLTENVLEEINQALLAHELIKIRISGSDKLQRQELIQQIIGPLTAAIVQEIGHILVIYRKKLEK